MKTIYQRLQIDNAAREKAPLNLARNEGEATIYLYDIIDADWGVGAREIVSAINSVKDSGTLNLRINSPGGDVFEARAIVEAIRRFEGKTIAHIDSLAASAATSIALAADEVVIAKGAMFMIHNASGMVWGDKRDMRETADLLEKVEIDIVDGYTAKTGKTAPEIVAMMDSETWMTAEEAIANGFCDRMADTAKAKNTWNLSEFTNAPDSFKKPEEEPEPIPEPSMTTANANRLRLLTVL